MKRIFVNGKLDFGAVGSAYGARTAVTVGVTTYVVIPAGLWIVETDAHCSVVVCYDINSNSGPGGSSHNITLVAASGVGYGVFSDGTSTFFLGDGTGGTGHQSQLLALA